jgi:hypothetical protein
MEKKYNLPAVNTCLHNFIPGLSRMFPETSGKLFGDFSVPRRTCHNRNYGEVTPPKNTILRL